jgi:hypothetical protein
MMASTTPLGSAQWVENKQIEAYRELIGKIPGLFEALV